MAQRVIIKLGSVKWASRLLEMDLDGDLRPLTRHSSEMGELLLVSTSAIVLYLGLLCNLISPYSFLLGANTFRMPIRPRNCRTGHLLFVLA